MLRILGALALVLAAPSARADLLLLEMGGVGIVGLPSSATVIGATGTSAFSSVSDIPSGLVLNGWDVEVSFNGLGYYPGGSPQQSCTGAGLCTDTAFPSSWSSQALFTSPPTMQVTRPGFDSSGNPTTVTTTVNLVAPLRQTWPGTNPVVAQVGGSTVADFVASNYIFTDDTTGALNFSGNTYYDGTGSGSCPGTGGCNIVNVSVPVANNSTRGYPSPMGAWVSEPDMRVDGSTTKCVDGDTAGNCTIEFFAGHSYGQGGKPVAAVKITVGDQGYAATASTSITAGVTTTISLSGSPVAGQFTAGALVTDDTTSGAFLGTISSYNSGTKTITLVNPALSASTGSTDVIRVTHTATEAATLSQSKRLPSTTCTAATGSNILTACGSLTWAKVGQRVNVGNGAGGGVKGQPVIGNIVVAGATLSTGATCVNTNAGCIELYVQENATFNTDGSLTIDAANGGVGGVALPGGTVIADGGFANGTITEVGSGHLWGAGNPTKTIVIPYGTSSDATSSGVSVTLPTPVQGQWRPGMFLTDANTGAPCVPSDHVNFQSEYLTYNNFSFPTATLGYALNSSCNGHVLAGLAIASLPNASANYLTATSSATPPTSGSATFNFSTAPSVTVQANLVGMNVWDTQGGVHYVGQISAYNSGTKQVTLRVNSVYTGATNDTMVLDIPVGISTSATTATGGTDTVQFNQNSSYSGSVTITSGTPVPTWDATFTPSDFTNIMSGPIYYEAKVYPVVGNQILDTAAPMPQGAQVATTSPWIVGATTITLKNCAGILYDTVHGAFYDQRGTEVFDLTTSQAIGLASSCIGNTLTLKSAATIAGGSGDVLAVGVNVNCDWWFWNYNGQQGFFGANGTTSNANGAMQSCTPSSPAWFGNGITGVSQGVADAEEVTLSLHNLFGYYDPSGSAVYPPIRVWVAGSAGGSPAVQTTATDPGTAAYYGSVTTAIAAIKTYNNSHGHNDSNAGVVCIVASASPLIPPTTVPTLFGWVPGLTITSAVTYSSGTHTLTNGLCPGPGEYGGSPSTVQISEGTNRGWQSATPATGTYIRVQNLTIANTGSTGGTYVFEGPSTDNIPFTFFAKNALVLDNDFVTTTSTNVGVFQYINSVFMYDILDNESVASSRLLGGFGGSSNVVPTLIAGSTLIGANYGNAVASLSPTTMIGTDSWGVSMNPGWGILSLTPQPWPNAEIIAFDRISGGGPAASNQYQLQPASLTAIARNILLTTVFAEQLNDMASNSPVMGLSGDSNVSAVDNVDWTDTTMLGGRADVNYIEGTGIPNGQLTSTLGTMTADTYFTVPAYTRVSAISPIALPTSTDNGSTGNGGNNGFTPQPAVFASGSTNSTQWRANCDFQELVSFYLSNHTGLVLGGTEGTFTVSANVTSASMSVNSVTPSGSNHQPGMLTIGSFIWNGSDFIRTTAGVPIYLTVTNNQSGATGTYSLSGTPAASSMLAGTYSSVVGTPSNYADVAIIGPTNALSGNATGGSPSGNTLTLGSALPATVAPAGAGGGSLYVGATLTNGASVLYDNTSNCTGSGLGGGNACPLQIGSCPTGGCNAAGNFTLGYYKNAVFTSQTPAASQIASGNTYYGQATQLNMCQTINLIQPDALTNNAPVASTIFPLRNYLKTRFVDKFNVTPVRVIKSDWYSSLYNGGRMGNWEMRFGVEVTGDALAATGSYFQPGTPNGWTGEVAPTNTYFDSMANVTIFTDQSAMRFLSGDDRSSGGANGQVPITATYPGLNIGEGDGCPISGSGGQNGTSALPSTNGNGLVVNGNAAAGRVLAAQVQAMWPFDIEGNTRRAQTAGADGWSGAYESTCF